MAKGKIGVHGTDAETGRGKEKGEKKCVITRDQFRQHAPAAVTVPATVATKKEYATGTLGYFAQVSMVVEVDGVPTKMTGNCQLYVANSKEAE